jgi:serine/threonine protein kinase
VMERIVGDSVHNMLAKDDEKQGSNNSYALLVVEQMIGQVAGLHHARIAHGDIKLKNIMDTLQGTMRLVDFGKAQKIDAQATSKVEASYGGDIRMIGRLLPEMLPRIQDQYDDVAQELIEATPSDPALIAIKKFADTLQSAKSDLGPEAIVEVSREFTKLKQALSKPRGGSTGSKKPDDEAAIADILHDAKIKDETLIGEVIAAYKKGKPYDSKAQIAQALASVLARLPDRVGEELVAYLAENYL